MTRKETVVVVMYVALIALAVLGLYCVPDVLATGMYEGCTMTEQTFNNLLHNSNALFDRNNDIWPKESILTKLQKNTLPEIR